MSNTSYKSISKEGNSLYEEKKSVFYGFAIPVQTEEQAILFIQKIKKEYPDARHHVYAYKIRENNTMRYTDDGEPSGTAGVPILDIIQKQDLTDICVIVVRYFGGTLLGTGGLVHAYSDACKNAILDAKPIRLDTLTRFSLTVSYSNYQKLQSILKTIQIENTDFSDNVRIDSYLNPNEIENFQNKVKDVCFGDYQMELRDTFYGIAEYL